MHRVVAATAFVAHLAFVGFTIVGGFLVWLLPGLLIPHIAAAAWGGRMAVTKARCPLSTLENWGRAGAGRERLDDRGFIAHYFEGKVYPKGWARRIEVTVGGLILGSWALIATR
ncbi:DUF2784 domain-containing protein [Nocardioides agariphilus]|uniref:DUF2784 domain-containing protein n=1 Tax=Nocardioides agariphilus TaxID=433664 RepID=A0A930VHL3_9ACTN|nr:DUF2784 domain-containing protein [Nocardioides agariphilus]